MRYLVSLTLLILIAATAWAAAPLRPYSGCGVLLAQGAPGAEPSPLPFYAEPGVQRLAELDLAALPRLSGDREQPVLAVYATKGGWLKLAWDDAGRSGWVEGARNWEYRSWDDYLTGRQVKVLPGLKKNLYALKGAPRDGSADAGNVTRDQQVRIVQVTEDWARLERPAGWLRWRDVDGRLTVSP
ncbi:hypothetical protein GMLC_29970 [Geomonas limicola]|uniref:SH3b domain-containing protein n=1 Tax=Geomonas limicola TaxID=2740186 RepID=A0A6V8NA08_9BACT|nr:SH3 domain-containing protein [Geomonas limicola]GFO69418.1 hypothetical protein GMLC_29970 [Geomonas limicola]